MEKTTLVTLGWYSKLLPVSKTWAPQPGFKNISKQATPRVDLNPYHPIMTFPQTDAFYAPHYRDSMIIIIWWQMGIIMDYLYLWYMASPSRRHGRNSHAQAAKDAKKRMSQNHLWWAVEPALNVPGKMNFFTICTKKQGFYGDWMRMDLNYIYIYIREKNK